MAANSPNAADVPAGISRAERPWLLPTNRKIRNLISVSLRNLSLSAVSAGRQRRQTIDDDAVPNALKSPAKMVALREQKPLAQSRSSGDLRSVAEDGSVEAETVATSPSRTKPIPGQDNDDQTASTRALRRPSMRKMRRRSTLDWNNASPQKRQDRLERATIDRMADVFYSLHVDGVDGPIYISECLEQTNNPTFGAIDLSHCDPSITRQQHLSIRFWARETQGHDWKPLLDNPTELSTLQFLGRTLDTNMRALPPNAIIINLVDGWYTPFSSFTTLPSWNAGNPTSRPSSSRSLPTSSFDALLRLAKLDESIHDALATRDQIAADLETVVNANQIVLAERDRVHEAKDRLKTIEFAKSTVQKQLQKATSRRAEIQNSIEARRAHMDIDAQHQTAARHAMEQVQMELPNSMTEDGIKKKATRNQRRRIYEELQTCYPIEPLPKRTLAFTVCGLHLPNSDGLDSEPPDKVSAALGLVSHVLLLTSFYLGQTLPYPVRPKGSNSTIYDPLSLLKTNASASYTYKDEDSLRTYPLFSKGVPRFRFDYAVFLLNKNIQVLLESAYNVRVLDIRHTLPNLKYLLYVATAGEGELPARKAGGVRGLLRSRPGSGGRPPLSREGSQDSTSSVLSGRFWHGSKGGMNGRPTTGGATGEGGAGSAIQKLKNTAATWDTHANKR